MAKKKNWVTVLVKEARRNPAKAALLAALAIVACYLWGGRILHVAGSADGSPATASLANGVAASSASTNEVVETSVGQVNPMMPEANASRIGQDASTRKPIWIRFQEWSSQQQGQDAITTSLWRDPFQAPVAPPSITASQEPPEATAQVDVDQTVRPDDLGLQLRAVIAGPRCRLAILGEQVVGEGEQIVLHHKGHAITIRIAKIGKDNMSIIIGQEAYELRLPPVTDIDAPRADTTATQSRDQFSDRL